MDLKILKRAIEQISEEKGINQEKILEAIESSIAAAYKKEYEKKGEVIKAKFNLKTGKLHFWQIKTVVDETLVRFKEDDEEAVSENAEPVSESVAQIRAEEEAAAAEREEQDAEKLPRFNGDRHILLEDAQALKQGIGLGEEIEFPLETKDDFGRIAAQAAKQVILQKIREAERESIITEFKGREGEILTGMIQRMERGNIYIDLGRATAVMFYNEAIPGERYQVGDRLKFYILDVQDDSRSASIILSRAHPWFVRKLFELEIPEIGDKTIEIKSIAREPGNRTKIAVASNADGVDPVGACVGQRGTRVMAVSNELGQEKIDIIEWSEDPAEYIASALSPAEVSEVEILPDEAAVVYVAADQLSLAIGRGGQNVRLASRLTGWKIDVRSKDKSAESDDSNQDGVDLGGEDAEYHAEEKETKDE